MSAPLGRRAMRHATDAAWRVGDRVGRSAMARRLVYSLRNRQLFTDLFAHERMLSDRIRVDTYHAAIAKHIRPGDVVVDLGTGTGVLALFAAKMGAREVHAIEHGPMAEPAAAVARDNGLDAVTVHHLHSRKFELPSRADVLIHEQIGSVAFEEGVVENVVDLRDRVLKPGGLILPSRLRLYVEPVQMPAGDRIPFVWEMELHGVRFRAMADFAGRSPYRYRYRVCLPFPFERFLTEPEPVVAVDLQTARRDELVNRTIRYERPITADGTLDGMCAYFDTAFDDELGFTSSPAAPPTSWGAALLRVQGRPVRAGQILSFSLSAADLAAPQTWEWDVEVREP